MATPGATATPNAVADAAVAPAAAVALKLPDFWHSKPRAWFHTVESQFVIRQITNDATRYHYVVSALGSDASSNLESLLRNPPDTGKYDAIKNRLLGIYELSEREKKRQLINLDGLGDRKPTELLRHMQSLHQTAADDVLFSVIFLQQLPATVRTILSAQDFDDVEELAKAADDVLAEHLATSPAVQAARQPATRPSQPKQFTKDPANAGLCWYHRKFGADAKSCRSPCTWTGNAPASH